MEELSSCRDGGHSLTSGILGTWHQHRAAASAAHTGRKLSLLCITPGGAETVLTQHTSKMNRMKQKAGRPNLGHKGGHGLTQTNAELSTGHMR